MYLINVYDKENNVNVRSAGAIANMEQIIDFLGNHTDMTYDDREDFAYGVFDSVSGEEGRNVFTGPALKDDRPLEITVTWEG